MCHALPWISYRYVIQGVLTSYKRPLSRRCRTSAAHVPCSPHKHLCSSDTDMLSTDTAREEHRYQSTAEKQTSGLQHMLRCSSETGTMLKPWGNSKNFRSKLIGTVSFAANQQRSRSLLQCISIAAKHQTSYTTSIYSSEGWGDFDLHPSTMHSLSPMCMCLLL